MTRSLLASALYCLVLAACACRRRSPVPVIVWIQGESDAASAPYAAAYETNLSIFFSSLENDIPAFANAKIVIVKLHINSRNGAANETTVAQVRAAQIAFVSANNNRARLVDIDDLALQGDNVHFTETTAITVGLRIAAAIGEMIS